MQFERNVFPSPVLPKKSKFFSSGSSKLFIKLIAISFIFSIFFLGEILALYFDSLISSEYSATLKLSKFSFSRFPNIRFIKI